MKFFANKNKKGFTLIETLVSMLIFSVSIVALISITAGGVSDTGFVKKKQTAYLLAQEGIELVRYVRDTSMRYGGQQGWAGFLQGMSDCAGGDGCTIDAYLLATNSQIAPAVEPCNGSCDPLLEHPVSGFYQYGGGQDTGYVRTIKFNGIQSSNNEIEVVSEVSWEHGGDTASIVMSEVITGWVRQLP